MNRYTRANEKLRTKYNKNLNYKAEILDNLIANRLDALELEVNLVKNHIEIYGVKPVNQKRPHVK